MADTNAFLIYQDDNGVSNVNVRFEGEDVWLTAEQLQQLFQASQQDVHHHIQQIYADGELLAEATNKKYLLVRNEGNRSVSRNILALSQGRGQNSEAMQNRTRRVPRRGVGKRGGWSTPARRGRLGYDALPSPTLRQYQKTKGINDICHFFARGQLEHVEEGRR